jgi:HlyD family secretion protein
MRKTLTWLMVITLSIGLFACSQEQKKSPQKIQKTYTVKNEVLRKTLYYSGVINPIATVPVIVPMNSTAHKIYANYGQEVKKGDKLISINAAELMKNFSSALTDFLKSKEGFETAKAKFIGTKELWDAGIISKNTFEGDKSTLLNSRVSLILAKQKLVAIMDHIKGAKFEDIKNLHLSEFEKVKATLSKQYNIITLTAPISGIILHPPEKEKKPIRVGTQLKEGQVLAVIGSLEGIEMDISVSQIDIYKIKPSLPARIKSDNAPGKILKGYVSIVHSQASSNAGSMGGYPVFQATIVAPKLKPKLKKLVKVGMSVKIEVDIETKDVLMIPIAAVYQEQGKTMVNLKLKDGSTKPTQITTGTTHEEKVVVKSGLKAGDVIVYE